MANPWEEISLEDYEGHMRLPSVGQLQAMDRMMADQLAAFPARSVMILGVAGGNGLGHVPEGRFERLYGVDVNAAYLEETRRRFPRLAGCLECIRADLLTEAETLPPADLVIANLLVEYIGYGCFQRVLCRVRPRFVSCAIQADEGDGWVSDSPYLHAFDGLEQVHRPIEAETLRRAVEPLGYSMAKTVTDSLPNGKKLVRLDFIRATGEEEKPMELTYRRASLEDLELLTDTRVEILRTVNGLGPGADMSEVRRQACRYYQEALPAGRHTAFLVFDGDRFVGAGGVSYFQVMPTFHNPSGQKAYIMNIYTDPGYRRRGVARRTLDLLVRDARDRGVAAVSLEATDMGRPLYEAYGFVPMEHEMELPE